MSVGGDVHVVGSPAACFRRAAGIEDGDLLAATMEGDTITLLPARVLDKNQASFWSEARQQADRRASEDIAQGRVRSFNDAEDLIATLEAGDARCCCF
jgi:hypothetical protein